MIPALQELKMYNSRANYAIYDNLKLKKTPLLSIVCVKVVQRFNPLTAKLFNLNFHPLEVVSR